MNIYINIARVVGILFLLYFAFIVPTHFPEIIKFRVSAFLIGGGSLLLIEILNKYGKKPLKEQKMNIYMSITFLVLGFYSLFTTF